MTLGLVYGLGHTLNSTDTRGIQVTDNSSYSSVNEHVINDSYGIPHTFGAGLAYNHAQSLTFGVDYSLEKWSKVKYENSTDAYNDRSKIAAGVRILAQSYRKKLSETYTLSRRRLLQELISETPPMRRTF